MPMRARWSCILSLVLAAAACGPAPAGGPALRDRAVISELEMSELPGDLSVLDVVRRERPFWLNVRATRSLRSDPGEILVYQGDLRLGSVDALANIRASEVLRLEFLDASQAVARLPGIGTSRPAGAIVVHMRVG